MLWLLFFSFCPPPLFLSLCSLFLSILGSLAFSDTYCVCKTFIPPCYSAYVLLVFPSSYVCLTLPEKNPMFPMIYCIASLACLFPLFPQSFVPPQRLGVFGVSYSPFFHPSCSLIYLSLSCLIYQCCTLE